MKIYQPMLFLGLGGTGCKVGAELERRLREELCGPDGTWLIERMKGKGYLPYQLPSCLQFVYADLSTHELNRVRRRVVPSREHDNAAQRTMHLITDLIPAKLNNSAQVSQALRINLKDDQTIGWLPPADTDPKIGPLVDGAGQLPTVGRSVLFETIRRGSDSVTRGIVEALREINASGEALRALSGLSGSVGNPIDVFVAFSVAGGTGSGIFYDYLHLLGKHLRGRPARIYPIVLMPSAFKEGLGGGRKAELNAGASLIDLFRLIDDQNAQGIENVVGHGIGNMALKVRYPNDSTDTVLDATTVKTAFLIGRPKDGVDFEDLIRSMVSLVLSLVGVGPTDAESQDGSTEQTYQSFADDFINKQTARSAPADTGIGRRGVSTSTVAALTIPVEELADIVSSRILAEAVKDLTNPPGGRAENNFDLMSRFFTASGLDELRQRQHLPVHDPEAPIGYDAIMAALNARARVMSENLVTLHGGLGQLVSKMARNFDPGAAAGVLLREIDLFRLKRVVLGHPELFEKIDRGGFVSALNTRQFPPDAPPGSGFTQNPPGPQGVRRRIVPRLRYADPTVQQVVALQDAWYQWRTNQVWHTAWGENAKVWEPVWHTFESQLRALITAFDDHADTDPGRFAQRSAELFRDRLGVSYLLPPHDDGMEGFYRTVVDRLRTLYRERLDANSGEGDIVSLILGDDGWREAFEVGRERPERAVAKVLDLIKGAVGRQFRPDGGARPLLPRMPDLLAAAAGRTTTPVDDADLAQFHRKLAGLVPGGYAPAGEGELRVLFTYPAPAADSELERFLSREVALPDAVTPEFRPIQADSLVVVLFRTSMGVTEVAEVRAAVQLWANALRREDPQDCLPWRRRLIPDSDYLLMTRDDQVLVLHRLLCAIWNGQVQAVGEERSPEAIRIRVGHRGATQVGLDLTKFRNLSSWASVLQSFEEWVLSGDEATRRELARALMGELPSGLDRNPAPPSDLFTTVVDLAQRELKLIDETRRRNGAGSRLGMFEDFWLHTMPAALELPFRGGKSDFLNLRDLLESMLADGSDAAVR